MNTLATHRKTTSSLLVQQGFTLLEMLLALAIFAVLSMASYRLLATALSEQQLKKDYSLQLSQEFQILEQLRRDLINVLPAQPIEAPSGVAIFKGDSQAMVWQTRKPTQTQYWPHWQVQPVEYRFEKTADSGRFFTDSSDPSSPKLIANSVWLRYRDSNNRWHNQWPPTSDSSDNRLPLAVEINVREGLFTSWSQLLPVGSALWGLEH